MCGELDEHAVKYPHERVKLHVKAWLFARGQLLAIKLGLRKLLTDDGRGAHSGGGGFAKLQ